MSSHFNDWSKSNILQLQGNPLVKPWNTQSDENRTQQDSESFPMFFKWIVVLVRVCAILSHSSPTLKARYRGLTVRWPLQSPSCLLTAPTAIPWSVKMPKQNAIPFTTLDCGSYHICWYDSRLCCPVSLNLRGMLFLFNPRHIIDWYTGSSSA